MELSSVIGKSHTAYLLVESANEPVVLTMMPYPEPDHVRTIFHGCGSIMDPYAGRPHTTNLLEVKRWMA